MEHQTRIAIVADDEKGLRWLTSKALTKAGFAVVEAVDAESAIEELTRHAPRVHALVTDICMPGNVNGLELAQIARQIVPDIAILVCSGTITPGSDVLPAGAEFLRKPYSLQDLDTRVGNLAQNASHARRQLAVARASQ